MVGLKILGQNELALYEYVQIHNRSRFIVELKQEDDAKSSQEVQRAGVMDVVAIASAVLLVS